MVIHPNLINLDGSNYSTQVLRAVTSSSHPKDEEQPRNPCLLRVKTLWQDSPDKPHLLPTARNDVLKLKK